MKLFSFLLSLTLSFSIPSFAAVSQSTLEDQQSVELTVYNSNLGLVKDVRNINLSKGDGELRFMDVASSIDPVTVSVKSLSAANEFSILDQNYEYDLISEEKLLDKYVGKDIKILQWNDDLSKKEETKAKLLSNNQGQVYQVGNEIYLGHPGTKILPQIPENLIAKPTLTWNYANKSAKPHQLEVSYLTHNVSWKADYILTLAKDDASLDLAGWVTLDNQSGAAYKNAKLKLVAGDVNRAGGSPYPEADMMMKRQVMMAAAAPQFQEQAFFEYHIYDLQRKVTIKDRQMKQIRLLEAAGVKAQKEYIVNGNPNFYYYRMPAQPNNKVDVQVSLKFKNAKENKLGMPLPQGIIRVYKKDAADSLQFVGEDRIEHTPKDEEVTLNVGKAFDIVAERVQKDHEQVSERVHESEWEITIRNHKDENVTVSLREQLHGDWKVLKNSHNYEKKDAGTLRFDVPVPKGKEVKVTYRVRITA